MENRNLQGGCLDDYYYDEEAAEDAVSFIEQFLKHSKGKWAGKPFLLEKWQGKIIRDVWGWKKPDGTRKHKTIYIFIPRKNGKSTLAAAFALLLTFADKEQGAEVYSAAASASQAGIVFEQAKSMLLASPELSSLAETFRRSIYYTKLNAKYEVLSADADTKHGLNASGIIFDELHAQPTRDLYDVLTTSTGARQQPLTIFLTTAGYDTTSICYEIHDYAKKVRDRIIIDDTFYPVIYEAEETDDWTLEATWKKSNPNYGVSIGAEYFREQVAKAKSLPSYENTFRRLHLNQWTQQATRWLPMDKWNACPTFDEKELIGKECFAGIDLASKADTTALVMLFRYRDGYAVIPHFWIPRANAVEREKRDGVPYLTWEKQGLLNTTQGTMVDYTAIVETVKTLADKYKFRTIAFDPWASVSPSLMLQAEGFSVVEMRQGYKSLSDPSKQFQAMITAGRIYKNKHAVLDWQASNVSIESDSVDNIKPSKQHSTDRIDGIVALVMAVALAENDVSRHRANSIYENRGALIL